MAGAVIGGLLGWLIVTLMGVQYVAESQVDAGPSSSVEVAADQANRFVQTQLVTMADAQARRDVAEQLGLEDDDPDIKATQVGFTDVVTITATDAVKETAVSLANATAQRYVQDRQVQVLDMLDRQQAALEARIKSTSALLKTLPSTGGTAVQQAQRAALISEYQDLVQQLGQIQGQKDASQASDGIVTLANPEDVVLTPSLKVAIALGILLGALVGIAIEIVLVRREPWQSTALARVLGHQ